MSEVCIRCSQAEEGIAKDGGDESDEESVKSSMVHDSFVGTDNRYDGCQSVRNRNNIVRGRIKNHSES
jgi:hypothetical protein